MFSRVHSSFCFTSIVSHLLRLKEVLSLHHFSPPIYHHSLHLSVTFFYFWHCKSDIFSDHDLLFFQFFPFFPSIQLSVGLTLTPTILLAPLQPLIFFLIHCPAYNVSLSVTILQISLTPVTFWPSLILDWPKHQPQFDKCWRPLSAYPLTEKCWAQLCKLRQMYVCGHWPPRACAFSPTILFLFLGHAHVPWYFH